MSENRLGIVLPTIGREFYLEKSITSLLNQTERFDEFIIYDNSIEQSLQSRSKYRDSPYIRWIKSGKQVGPIESWNNAIIYSNCEYVLMAGDDDVFDENYVSEAKHILESCDIGFLKPIIIDEDDTKVRIPPFPSEEILTSDEFRYARFKNKISLYVPGAVFKKELFEKVGGYQSSGIDSLIMSDELLYFKMAVVAKNVGFSTTSCWRYRKHSDQIGGLKDISVYIDQLHIYRKILESSLVDLGLEKDRIYFSSFKRQSYLDKLSNYGLREYGVYSRCNKSFILLIKDVVKYFLLDKRISISSRTYTFMSMLKRYFQTSCKKNH